MAHDIFISYSSKDKDIADGLCQILESNNLKCWMAPRDLTGSSNYADEIQTAVDDAEIVLFVLSENSGNSVYNLEEIRRAYIQRRPILVYNISDELPRGEMEFILKNQTFLESKTGHEMIVSMAQGLVKSVSSENEGLNSDISRQSPDTTTSPQRAVRPNIFISYDDGDLNFAESEINRFNSQGYDIKASSTVSLENLKEEIDKYPLFVFLITNNFLNSEKVKQTIEIAFSNDKDIIPIYLEDVKLKFGMRFKLKHRSDLKKASSNAIFKHQLKENEYVEEYTALFEKYGFKPTSKEIEKDMLEFSSSKFNNFRYLEDLIKNSSQVNLESDIILDESEDDEYKDGIEINNEKLIVNGNNHTINARLKSRIFNIKGKEIIFKNINFINAFAESKGGAINSDGCQNLTFKSCSFENTYCMKYGGAIFIKNGKTTIKNSKFIKSESETCGGALQLEGGVIEIDNCIFEKNSSRLGGAIRCRETKLNISNSEFLKNDAKRSGGAINYKNDDLKITNTTFLENKAENQGGVFESKNGYLNISNCEFEGNSARRGGVLDNITQSNIKDCKIIGNTAEIGSVVFNKLGTCEIANCEISGNNSENDIITNKDSFKIHNTNFTENNARNIIFNEKHSNFSIYAGKFCRNSAEEFIIQNHGKTFSLNSTAFNENTSESKFLIDNESELTFANLKFEKNEQKMLNNGMIYLRSDSENLKRFIENNGSVESMIRKESAYDFTYLDELIHNSNSNEITLDQDIKFRNYEIDFYEGGIDLDIDNLTIDGAGKTIDGAEKSRIFIITAKNVTLKNIIFKNGHTHLNNYANPFNNNGGALRNNSKSNVTLENCMFLDNYSEDSGGAIENRKGSVKLIESTLSNNKSSAKGGAIKNNRHAKLEIINTSFDNNSSRDGGAIDNAGEMIITKSNLESNTAKYGGAISNNYGKILINASKLNSNNSSNGGAIHNHNEGKIEIQESTLNSNSAKSGGAIENKGYGFVLKDNELSENRSETDGGAIYNFHSKLFEINNCTITKNIADRKGGAIWNYSKSNKVNIIHSTIEENQPDNVFENK